VSTSAELMGIEEIVNKLIGPIHPVGHSSVDKKRLENLKAQIDLVHGLLEEIIEVRKHKSSHEYSVIHIGEAADKFIKLIPEMIEEFDS